MKYLSQEIYNSYVAINIIFSQILYKIQHEKFAQALPNF